MVIDGAKALRRPVVDTFGERVLLRRCPAHKKRNVLESLPERMRVSIRTAMIQAYTQSGCEARPPAAGESRAQTGARLSRRGGGAAGRIGRNL